MDSVRVMSALGQRNRVVGRENEPGLASRLAKINGALGAAARLTFRAAIGSAEFELSRSATP